MRRLRPGAPAPRREGSGHGVVVPPTQDVVAGALTSILIGLTCSVAAKTEKGIASKVVASARLRTKVPPFVFIIDPLNLNKFQRDRPGIIHPEAVYVFDVMRPAVPAPAFLSSSRKPFGFVDRGQSLEMVLQLAELH